ncbi:MAG: HD-GYP domain-containing protein [Candidatus Nanopelagicales bacterium]
MRPHRVPPAVKIALGYLVFAVAWVLVSDRVLDALVSDAGLEDCWQTVKGTVFVVASAVFVYFLTRRYLDRAEASTRRLAEAYDETLAGWAAALDIRDHSTGEHTARVTALAVDLGRRLGLSDDEIEQLRRGAILHDIGKMALPDRVLSKPGPLDEEEWALMRQHPDLAVQMLTDVSFLAPAMVVPAAHHERWDGTGYPRGLVGEEIPFYARVFAVVDVYDALTSDRTYRKPATKAEALDHIDRGAGAHFDPDVAHEFVAMMRT